ncbi:cellulose synthase family protein [Candidatus Uabimicrobium amorphum]|uniref:Glycosyl transferase n=1 Tax=Uabimicrobium amorphum TaxID=2596890 RepID=A0A5S9IPJ5_UABAM|nr:cellulose synthase family protein [Candidatus Uabimicrobium amorphum]BBM85699.1 glycosyl transferase [Candidatus Uabimicrobium amorphum]
MSREILLTFYFITLCILSIYGLHRYQLLHLYYKYKRPPQKPRKKFPSLPHVTIQLPIYNEMYVVERLIDSVAAVDYPKDLLEIQVLDDSTDETQKICQKKVEEYQQKLNIHYIHRTNREGFKAGALANGMQKATGEFIAIFDADFVPCKNFLHDTIHYFTDEKVGLIQARWEHINRDDSLLTQVQSIFLDGHFMIEQTARNSSGRFFNFNGTAGIWRKETIIDAGGWEHDTLTEDMDLSFRAQIKNWQFIFLPNVAAPAELPMTVSAFKSQQHRWSKGTIQVCKKLLIPILKSKAPFKAKTEAFIQLTNNFVYLLMFVFSLLMFPALIYRTQNDWYTLLLIDLPLFIAATISINSFYAASQIEIHKNWLQRLKYLPFVTAIGIGLCVSNSKAVLEAIFNHKTGFVRTPKYNAKNNKEKSSRRYKVKNNILPYVELALAVYFCFIVHTAYKMQAYVAIPFLLLFLYGYAYMATITLWEKFTISHKNAHIETGEVNQLKEAC